MYQPGLFELAEVIGDLRLTHVEIPLELADANAGVLIPGRNAADG